MQPVTAEDLLSCLGDLDAFGEKILSVKNDEGKYTFKWVPHEGQKRLIEASSQINLVTAGNAAGKTMGLTIDDIYSCLYKIDLEYLLTTVDEYGNPLPEDIINSNKEKWLNAEYKTLCCSFEYKVAKIVFDNIVALYNSNPLFRNILIDKISQTENRVYWYNGAQTHCLSLDEGGKHTEGNRYRRVYVDEAGWEPNLKQTYYTVLMPRTLGVNGITKIAGTPKDMQSGWVDELHQKAKDEVKIAAEKAKEGKEYKRKVIYIQMPTNENPYLPPGQVKELEEATKDYPAWHRMVFYGELVEGSGKVLTAAQINNAIDTSLPNDSRDIYGEPTKGRPIMWGTTPAIEGHNHITFWDIGMKLDWAVGITLDVSVFPFEQRNYTRVNKTNIKGYTELFYLMHREFLRYGNVQRYDATGQAGGILEEYLRDYARDNDIKLSWTRPLQILGDTGKKDLYKIGKQELINCLSLAFSYKEPIDNNTKQEEDFWWGKIRIPRIEQEIKELRGYRLEDKKIAETDSVISLAGCCAAAPNPRGSKIRFSKQEDLSPLLDNGMVFVEI